MDIRRRSALLEIKTLLDDIQVRMTRLSSRLKRNPEDLTGTFVELGPALDRVTAAVGGVENLIERLADEADRGRESGNFSVRETRRLEHLNRVMNKVSQFMHQTADVIRPGMDAKVEDDFDPMFDFEIEAKIDYQLREDDSEWDEDSDNYISSRSEMLSRDKKERELKEDWRYGLTPEPFKNEPLSWLLHSLTEHSFGENAPRVRPRDCLRIGTVFMDIQVWWQYAFDVDSGKWIKRWKEPERTPVYMWRCPGLRRGISNSTTYR